MNKKFKQVVAEYRRSKYESEQANPIVPLPRPSTFVKLDIEENVEEDSIDS